LTHRIRTSNLAKHCLNSTIIIAVALVTLSRFITAPADYAPNGQDITYAEPGWIFYERYLRSSILEKGTVPLWLRTRYSGYIYVGDPQVSTYYISSVVLVLSPNELLGIRYNIVLHMIMSGLFMYVLMNVWKQRHEASIIGAIGYMLSGFFISRVFAGHLPMIYAYPWMPLVLASFDLSYERNSAKYATLTAFSLFMQILSGGYVIFVYSSLLLGVYAIHKLLVRLVSLHRNLRTVLKQVGQTAKLLAVIVALTLGMAALKIVPVVEEMAYTGRGTLLETSAILKGHVSSWSQLQELFTYDGHGSPIYPYAAFPKWGVWAWWEYWFYLGPLTIILGILGISQVRRNPTTAFLVLSTVISILLARGLLIEPLVRLMPFAALIHVPSRFLVITQLTIPALATTAVTAAQNLWEDKTRRSRHTASLRLWHASKLIAYGLTLILIMDLIPRANSLIWTVPMGQENTPAMQFMRSASSNETYRIHTSEQHYVIGYSGSGFEMTRELGWEFAIQIYVTYLEAAESGAYKMFGPLNTKYVVSSSEISNPDCLHLERVFPDNTRVYLNTLYMSRLWTAQRAILIISNDRTFWENEAIGLLKSAPLNPQRSLLVRGEFVDDFTPDMLRKFDVIYLPSTTSPPARSPSKAKELLTQYSGSGGIILESGQPIPEDVWARLNSGDTPPQPRITDYKPNWLEASVTLEKPAFLFVSEVFIPGWHLYVNGQEAPIYQMDDIFFGTMLEEGEYRLRVEFNPASFKIGSAITGITLLALVSVAVFDLRKFLKNKKAL